MQDSYSTLILDEEYAGPAVHVWEASCLLSSTDMDMPFLHNAAEGLSAQCQYYTPSLVGVLMMSRTLTTFGFGSTVTHCVCLF